VRIKSALVVLLIAVVSTATVTVTGQEEPLPRVTPRSAPFEEFVTVALAVEPVREVHQPTLAEAARNNDFVTFDALYRDARRRGEAVAAFETLHELWVYAVTDPIGAFYGVEMYERFARAYPGYSSYIDDMRILDDRGTAYYPTSETRAFLLDRALEGRAPRVLVATREAVSKAPASSPAVSAPPALSGAEVSRRRATAKSEVPAAAPSVAAARVVARTAPVVVQPPAVVPQPTAVLVQPPVVVAAPVVAAPPTQAATSAGENASAPRSDAGPNPSESTPLARENVFASRGILLLVMGLVGIGLLAVMLRTPRESQSMSIMPPAPPEKPPAPVEPLRRPDAPRKTGSHG
jgi:hypothetical protein